MKRRTKWIWGTLCVAAVVTVLSVFSFRQALLLEAGKFMAPKAYQGLPLSPSVPSSASPAADVSGAITQPDFSPAYGTPAVLPSSQGSYRIPSGAQSIEDLYNTRATASLPGTPAVPASTQSSYRIPSGAQSIEDLYNTRATASRFGTPAELSSSESWHGTPAGSASAQSSYDIPSGVQNTQDPYGTASRPIVWQDGNGDIHVTAPHPHTDVALPGDVIEKNGIIYPAIPGTNTPDYSRPGFKISK